MADIFNRSDVFISYSRRNKEFVQRLDQAFKAQGLEVWVDWEDIPPTADWWREIQAGIDAAEAFVFIISPDSIQSDICAREIEHAVTTNKRFIPVLYREITDDKDKQRIPPVVSSHNWIFFRESDDFEASFARLIDALRTDLGHVQTHTRLYVRAREWVDRNRNHSLLLFGDDLNDAEEWLATAMNKNPHPTDMHVEYINASRQHAVRRQRRFLTLMMIFSALVVLLSIVAVFQWRDAQVARDLAEDAREQAERTAEEASSLALAAAAEQALSNSNPDLALALALQSVEIENPPPLAHRALADVTYGPGTRYLLAGHDAFISVVAYSPNGETILSAGGDGSLCLWDAEDGSMIRCESAHDGVVTGAVYLENGEEYLTVSEDGTMRRWETESGELLRQYDFESAGLEFQVDETGTTALVRSADGEVLLSSASANSGTLERYSFAGGFEGGLLSVAVDEERGCALTGIAGGLILLWDLDTGEVIRKYDAHTDDTVSVDFSPDGRLFASASDDETAIVWEVEKDRPLAVLEGHRNRLLTVRFSPDGRILATGSWDTTVILWDMRTFEEIRKFEGHTGGVTHIEFLPEKQAILTSSWDNSLRMWNMVTGVVLREFNGHTGGVNALAISPDRSVAISGAFDTFVRVWDVNSVLEVDRLIGASGVNVVQFSPDGRILAAGYDDNMIVLWDMRTHRPMKTLEGHNDHVNELDFTSDGALLASGDDEGSVLLWDVATGELLWRRDMMVSGAVGGLDFSFDDSLLLVGGGALVHLLDIDGAPITTFEYEGRIVSATFHPDGTKFAIGLLRADNNLLLADVQTGDILRQYDGHTDGVLALAFNQSGSQLLSGSFDNSMRLWDVETAQLINTFIGHSERIGSVAFAPDGKFALSGSNDVSMRLWDVELQREIYAYKEQTERIQSVAFSPDGRLLVSGSRDGSIVIWSLPWPTEQAREWAQQNRYLRTLTCAEQKLYLVNAECED